MKKVGRHTLKIRCNVLKVEKIVTSTLDKNSHSLSSLKVDYFKGHLFYGHRHYVSNQGNASNNFTKQEQ